MLLLIKHTHTHTHTHKHTQILTTPKPQDLYKRSEVVGDFPAFWNGVVYGCQMKDDWACLEKPQL